MSARSGACLSHPPDNPFAGRAAPARDLGARPAQSLALLLRRATGQLWIGDVGQNTREEIDVGQRRQLRLNIIEGGGCRGGGANCNMTASPCPFSTTRRRRRTAWIRAEAPLISALAASRSALDLGTAVVEQLAAVSMFEVEDEVLPERREQLRSQRAALLDAVATDLPDWRSMGRRMALWMQLPAPMSTALAATSPYHGVLLAAGPRFGLEGAFERYIRLPYARGEEELRAAVTGIAAAYRALSGAWKVNVRPWRSDVDGISVDANGGSGAPRSRWTTGSRHSPARRPSVGFCGLR